MRGSGFSTGRGTSPTKVLLLPRDNSSARRRREALLREAGIDREHAVESFFLFHWLSIALHLR
jgi:hypothetical protein